MLFQTFTSCAPTVIFSTSRSEGLSRRPQIGQRFARGVGEMGSDRINLTSPHICLSPGLFFVATARHRQPKLSGPAGGPHGSHWPGLQSGDRGRWTPRAPRTTFGERVPLEGRVRCNLLQVTWPGAARGRLHFACSGARLGARRIFEQRCRMVSGNAGSYFTVEIDGYRLEKTFNDTHIMHITARRGPLAAVP